MKSIPALIAVATVICNESTKRLMRATAKKTVVIQEGSKRRPEGGELRGNEAIFTV